jgi:hypothetical protein
VPVTHFSQLDFNAGRANPTSAPTVGLDTNDDGNKNKPLPSPTTL